MNGPFHAEIRHGEIITEWQMTDSLPHFGLLPPYSGLAVPHPVLHDGLGLRKVKEIVFQESCGPTLEQNVKK